MKKVSILALHLNYGGIEKAITTLANYLCNDFKVEIACTYKISDKPAFNLDKRVKVVYLNSFVPNKEEFKTAIKEKGILKILKEGIKSIKILYLRKKTMINYIKTSDSNIIISSRLLFNKILSKSKKKNVLTIGWEHNHYHGNLKLAKKTAQSVKNLNYFVLVSQELQKDYEKLLKNTNCNCIYIPNTIDEIPSEKSKLTEKRLISIGRLAKEKGYIDLLNISKSIFNKYPDWHLDIIGDGDEKENLINYIKENNLSKYITLHGFKNTEYINNILAKSSIYLMTSFTESFGIVLLEASSFGIPLIAFDSAEGAKEIINDGLNGYLIPNRDKNAYLNKLEKLINDYNLRIKMGQEARKKAFQYTPKEVMTLWNKILK